jgi:N-acetyl-anhydromuramyl-L-alanine amidase AmpD
MSKFLTPDKIRNEYGLEIKEKLIPDGSKLKPNHAWLHGKVEYVTIHNTNDINEAKGTNDAEQYARATFNGAMGGVSVHYYIDETDCWQLLREDEMGYHAADGYNGPGNCTSLAIEIIMDGTGSPEDVGAEDRGAQLAAILLHRHGLGMDRLTTHRNWYPAKYCPLYILPHWNAFAAKVKQYLTALEAPRKTNEELAQEVIRGEWGNGEERKRRLTAAGYDYNEVQAIVSRIMAELRIMLGDVDGDGKVTAADARLVLRAAVGLEILTGDALKAADLNKDGKITAADARLILRKAVGLEVA